MATAGGYGGYRPYGSSSSINRNSSPDDYSSRRSNNQYSQNRNTTYGSHHSTDPDNITLDVVNEFKRTVQEKLQQNQQVNQPMLELEVCKIKRRTNPDRYDLNHWKRQLSFDVQNCPESILRVSMAYGDDPHRIKHVIQAKMNERNSNENPTDTSLDNIIEPLRRLQRELNDNPLRDLFRAVHNINDRHTDRADRLFFSEAHHFAPGLHDYTFDDAHSAVQAILETTYESEKPVDLIPIIKTFRDFNEIREYLEKHSSKTSKSSNDGHASHSNHTTNSPNRNNSNENPSYRYKPLEDPRQHSFPISGRSQQGSDNRSRDESSESPLRRDLERK